MSSAAVVLVRCVLFCLLLITICQGFYIGDYPEYNGFRPMKKSGQLRALAGGRNCFFSPINCVITHDMSTYRKLAGNNNNILVD